MDDISALLGLGMDDEMQTQALADSLRGRKRAADFFGMSTVGNLRDAARAEQGAISNAAQRGGVLRKAMADREAQAERDKAAQAAREDESRIRREFEAEEGRLDRKARMDAATAKANRPKELTRGQVSTALRNLGKEVKPVEDVIQSIEDLDSLLAPFYGSDDIPGLGRIEGQQNMFGKAARIFGPKEGENISQAKTKLLRAFIKESAGLAQTLSETQGVIESYGLENLSDEETFLRVYPEIKAAMRADLDRMGSAYLPEVVEQFESGYEAQGKKSPLGYQPRTLKELSTQAVKPDYNNMTLEQLRALAAQGATE